MSLFIYVAVMKAVLVAAKLRKKGIELFLKGGREGQLQAFKQDSFGNTERLGRREYLLLEASEQKCLPEHHSSTALLCTPRLQLLNIYKVGSVVFHKLGYEFR